MLHWIDGGFSDIDNAALLCQYHHTFVHTRRLWAHVRSTPDELGRYVRWDLSPGSYDRHLEWLARQRADHDPPPLTRTRLLELVADLTADDEATRRLAEDDLMLAAREEHWAWLRADTPDLRLAPDSHDGSDPDCAGGRAGGEHPAA